MDNIVPNGDLPAHVQVARFTPSGEMQEAGIQPAFGVIHYPEDKTDPEKRFQGDILGIELMFEVSREEIMTLLHEPYITLTLLTDSLPPLMLETTHKYDPRFKLTIEHTHRCPECDEHYRCHNPIHKMPESRKLICDDCWHEKMDEKKDELQGTEVVVDEGADDEVSS